MRKKCFATVLCGRWALEVFHLIFKQRKSMYSLRSISVYSTLFECKSDTISVEMLTLIDNNYETEVKYHTKGIRTKDIPGLILTEGNFLLNLFCSFLREYCQLTEKTRKPFLFGNISPGLSNLLLSSMWTIKFVIIPSHLTRKIIYTHASSHKFTFL